VVYSCNLSYLGDGGRKMESSMPAQAKESRPYLKKLMVWGHDLGGRALALHIGGSGFNLQYHERKKQTNLKLLPLSVLFL
jgi:hypothetical protein